MLACHNQSATDRKMMTRALETLILAQINLVPTSPPEANATVSPGGPSRSASGARSGGGTKWLLRGRKPLKEGLRG